MKRAAALLVLSLSPSFAQAPAPAPVSTTVEVPREKITLSCADTYFKSVRQNFLLADETYPQCTLRLPLALRQRWPGKRTFFLIPRVSATLHATDSRGQGRWLPLAPLVNPGVDPLHRAVTSADYGAVELSGSFGRLDHVAVGFTPDMISTGGRLTVCASPLRAGEAACTTFDLAARFKVYRRD